MKSLALLSTSMGTQYGGTETFVQTLATRLNETIKDIRLITGGDPRRCTAAYQNLASRQGVTTCHLPFLDRYSNLGRWLSGNRLGGKISPTDLESLTALFSVRKLSRCLTGVELLEAHYPLDGLFFPFLPKEMGKILHFHGACLAPLFRKSRKFILRHTDGFITCSRYARDELLKDLPGTAISVLYNGVDCDHFSPGFTDFQPPCHYDSGCLKVGLVARLSREKGCDLIRRVSGELQGEVEFFLAGPADSGYADQLKRLAQISNIHILGPIDHQAIPAFYRFLDCFVLPSHFEAFPLTLLEAMASGCAVVASQVGGIPEMIGSTGDAGMLIPVEDEFSFVGALRKLKMDESYRKSLAQGGRMRAQNTFSLEKTVAGALHIYERFAQVRSNRTPIEEQ